MAACGDLRLNEITTRVLGAHLRPFEDTTPEQARIARVVIRAALSYAVRQGHLTTNPARELEPIRKRAREPRALTRDEAHPLRALAIEQTALVTDDGVRWRGPTPIGDLELVIVLGLACGGRVGELLALRWGDLDLDAPVPTVEIGATLVRHPGQPVTRQEHTKTHSSRLIPLADGAVAALRNRAATGTDTVRVFSLDGRWLDPTVLRRRWNRMLEGTDLAWCTPHTLRRTAATWVRAARSTEAAAELLGHTSVLITERSYLQRARVTGDHREVLELD